MDEEEAEEELDDKPALQSQTISNAATAPDPLHETPLTRPPSPFLSNEIYHQVMIFQSKHYIFIFSQEAMENFVFPKEKDKKKVDENELWTFFHVP